MRDDIKANFTADLRAAEELTLQEALFFSCKRRRLSTMKIALILIAAAWMVCATVGAQGKGKASKSV